jgi:arsenate reductase-like glutaredoxin family protein
MDKDIGILASDERQFTLIYSSESSIGKQTLAYIESLEAEIRTIDITKTKFGDTVWVSMADEMKVPLEDLFSRDHPDAPEDSNNDFSTDDWLKLIKHNPKLLQQPIAIKGKKIKQISTPSEVLQFFEVDSAGLEKENIGDDPTTESETKGEQFIKGEG